MQDDYSPLTEAERKNWINELNSSSLRDFCITYKFTKNSL